MHRKYETNLTGIFGILVLTQNYCGSADVIKEKIWPVLKFGGIEDFLPCRSVSELLGWRYGLEAE